MSFKKIHIFSTLYPRLRFNQWLNIDFFILILFLFLTQAYFFSSEHLPTHDSLQVFQGFHYYYSHFFFFDEIPRWSLYGSFGTPIGFWQLVFFTPASYFSMFIGKILGVEDVLFLFKFSMLLEQLILLTGMYKLSNFLFQRRITTFFVCAGITSCTVWYAQLWWNFRIYYLIPLVLYFLFLFFHQKKPQYFWLAGITGVISLFGNLMYFGILWGYAFFIITLILTFKDGRAWLNLFTRSRKNVLSFLVFLGLLSLYISFTLYAFQEAGAEVGARNAEYQTSLDVFLTYGGKLDFKALIQMLLYGWPTFLGSRGLQDLTIYVGLFPLILCIYSLFHVRKNPYFYAILGGFVALLWLSAASGLATLLYYIPNFSLFRHIGMLLGLLKVFFFLLAGYGLQTFLQRGAKKHILVLFLVMLFLVDFFAEKDAIPDQHWWYLNSGWSIIVVLRILFYAVPVLLVLFLYFQDFQRKIKTIPFAINLKNWLRLSEKSSGLPQVIVATLIGAYLLDMLLFLLLVSTSGFSTTCKENCQDVTFFSPPPFQLERKSQPSRERSGNWLSFMRNIPRSATNVTVYFLAQFDPWSSEFNLILHPKGVEKLEKTRKESYGFDDPLKTVLALDQSKFRLVQNTFFAESEEEAVEYIKKTKNLNEILVLQGVPKENQTASPQEINSKVNQGPLQLIHGNSNRIEVQVEVFSESPPWLVYADSYHSNWQATVNEKEVPIAKAYLAFKAVPLQKGKNKIGFTFDGGWESSLFEVVKWVGIISCFWFLRSVFTILLFPLKKNWAEKTFVLFEQEALEKRE